MFSLCHCHWFGIHALSNEKPTSNFDLKIFSSGKGALYHLKLTVYSSITVYTNPVHSWALQQRAEPPSPQTDPSASSRCAGLRSCSSWTLQERRAHITFQGKWQISGPCHWYLWNVVLKANRGKKLIRSSGLWGNRQKEEWITQEHANGRRAELHPAPWIDGGEPLLGSWTLGRSMREGGMTEETRRFGIVQLFTLTDSLMTRWCCVCQQSCRLRMNGCLTCRCQKRTHARTHTDTQTHTDNEWREMDKQPGALLQNES